MRARAVRKVNRHLHGIKLARDVSTDEIHRWIFLTREGQAVLHQQLLCLPIDAGDSRQHDGSSYLVLDALEFILQLSIFLDLHFEPFANLLESERKGPARSPCKHDIERVYFLVQCFVMFEERFQCFEHFHFR